MVFKLTITDKVLTFAGLCIIFLGYTYLILSAYPSEAYTTCIFKNVTGILCPGCGMGRGTWLLLRGKLAEAFLMHPLSFPVNIFMLMVLAGFSKDIVARNYATIQLLKKRLSIKASAVIFALVGMSYAYLLLKHFGLLV